jgi:4'-phosphopantetheinyl transferase
LGALTLPDDDVALWYLLSDAVRDAATLERYTALLAPDERARHARFVFAKDRDQFLIARGFIRTLIARYLQIDPAACGFETDRYGRPSLVRPPAVGLAFNLTHTTGLIACAIAREPELGVDAEDTNRPVDLAVARRFFSAEEADAIDALPEAERRERFFEYWTLKEAYIKARGRGMALPLDGFSMHLDGAATASIRLSSAIDDDPQTWQFARFRPTARHRLAVAVRRHGRRDRGIHVVEFHPSAP